MFEAADKWSKILCTDCNMIDGNSLLNNSRFIVKINKLFVNFVVVTKISYIMLLLGMSGVP